MADYSVIVLREAQIDVEDIIEWYENQREGLGQSFFARYQHTERTLASNPYLFQENFLFVRRAIISHTSYTAYYAVDEQKKIVESIAVLHQKRDPDALERGINIQ